MKKPFKKLLLPLLLILVFIIPGLSQTNSSPGWTQFRGQQRSGISLEKFPQINWSESNLKPLWKKEIGSGFSELIISDGKIYTMISEEVDSITGFEFVVSYDKNTGDELWRSKVDSMFFDIDDWGNGPRSTPTLDENYIYSLSSFGKLTANSKSDGKLIWQIDFVKEFGSTVPRWGFSTSPLLIDNNIIIEAGGTDSKAFIAFDKTNGQIVWAKGVGNASYNSPLFATINSHKQVIFAHGNTLSSYNLNGDTLWTYKLPFGNFSAMPVFIGPNKIFVSAVRTPGFVIVEINNNIATEVINGSSMKNDFSSCCYHNGYIYGFHVAALRCISVETGETQWTKRGLGKGSLSIVDNKLLVLSDKGKLVIVEANPEAYTENDFIQAIKGKSWTAPSFQNGEVFVRNLTEMASFKLE